jgi:hypothetical protein
MNDGLVRSLQILCCLIVLAGCRQGSGGRYSWDAEADSRADGTATDSDDTVPTDASADSAADVAQDVDEAAPPHDAETGCSYPSSSHAFDLEQVVAPMSWPFAVLGADESGTADFSAFHCDPEVNSIFIQVATLVCPNCPTRVREIGGLREHWDAYGARWIFLVSDASSPAEASAYVDRNGVTFGWRSNDGDNTVGPGAVVGSPLSGGVPWTVVIRASDMTMVYEEPEEWYLDIQSIAVELASE